jgi:hypothetical protein
MGGSGVRVRLTGVILGATLLAGCAGLPNPFKDPDLHLQRAIAALDRGDLPYTLKGQLTVETPFGDRKISFTHEGRAPLTRVGGVLPIPTGL